MGRKALLAVVCWLTLSEALSESEKTVDSLIKDNISEESAPRLYRNAPFGVYASAVPHGSFSFHPPAFIQAQKAAGSHAVPVSVVHNANAYLKDSYGNRFVESPHSVAYKSPLHQQFVQLQSLPAHLAQPLVAAAPTIQIKQAAPQYFVGSQYRIPQVQAAAPTPIAHFAGQSQPLVYAENIRKFAPTATLHTQVHGLPTPQQQPSNHKAVFAVEQFKHVKNEPKFQKLDDRPQFTHVNHHNGNNNGYNHHGVQHDKAQQQAAPAKQTIVTISSGNNGVIKLETKPSVPLLDLSLLEPLTFANPIVPQVQHFLPKISSVTYHKLPEVEINQINNHQKGFGISNTHSYDSGHIQSRPKAPKRKQKRPHQDAEIIIHRQAQGKPTIKVNGNPNGGPEFSYEISSPNYKETYNEQVVSYNKETQMEPVSYSYDKKTESEPVTYSYSHSSKKPEQLKQIHYENNGQGPKQLIYNFKPEEQSGEHGDEPSHPPHQAESGESEESSAESEEEKPEYHSKHQEHNSHHEEHPKHTHHHREEEYHHSHHRPNQEVHHEAVHHESPHHYPQPIKDSEKNSEAKYQQSAPEYEERSLPVHKHNAPIKVDPGQHIETTKQTHEDLHPSPAPQAHHQQHQHQRQHHDEDHAPEREEPAPHVLEKSKSIIIQDEAPDESPEAHSVGEQLMAEMIDQDENNEENFEKGYKEAAYGFDSYDKQPDDTEKEIYNPESYGAARFQNDYEIDYAPLRQYEQEGDDYPRSSRLDYKKSRDRTKEDYYSGYSVDRPESFNERLQKKEDYYKSYKSNRPEPSRPNKKNKKQKQSNNYIAAPSYDFSPKPHRDEKKEKQYYSQYKAAPHTYEYDYSKGPRDSSAYASRPHQRFKSKTNFVEPQFQYGFEPISIPKLLDSELAAMASNDSPEKEAPGTRKKLYKENWYIKKTSTTPLKKSS